MIEFVRILKPRLERDKEKKPKAGFDSTNE